MVGLRPTDSLRTDAPGVYPILGVKLSSFGGTMSTHPPGPPTDAFALRATLRAVAPRIDHLAAAYYARSEPLRSALNTALQAGPDGWADALFSVAKLFPRGGVGRVFPAESAVPPSDTPPNLLARYALVMMVEAAAAGDRSRFVMWLERFQSDPAVAALANQELLSTAREIYRLSLERDKDGFVVQVNQVLVESGLELNQSTSGVIREAGGSLSRIAVRALNRWDDESAFSECVPVYGGLLAQPDRVEPSELDVPEGMRSQLPAAGAVGRDAEGSGQWTPKIVTDNTPSTQLPAETEGGSRPDEPPRVSLSDNDYTVLRALRNRHPVRIQVADLSAVTKIGEKACKQILRSLIGRGLAERPSPRKGATITPAGEALLAASDTPRTSAR